MDTQLNEIEAVRREARCLFNQQEVSAAITRLAQELTGALSMRNPLILCVMNGGMMFAGQLLLQLDFPLEIDSLIATRYRGQTQGDAFIEWRLRPQANLAGRTVLILDDILDEGFTLAEILRFCQQAGAAQVLSAVLVEKKLDCAKPCRADFVGLAAENHYLYGYGMDYKGYWRNAAGIYAIAAS